MMSNLKVLVVDDEDAVRSLVKSLLEAESFVVQSAGDGEEAIELIRSKSEEGDRFDIILLDIKMQKVDGFEVLRFAKASVPETKVIMATAYADVKNAIRSTRLGTSDFIAKPYDLDDILMLIYRVMGK